MAMPGGQCLNNEPDQRGQGIDIQMIQETERVSRISEKIITKLPMELGGKCYGIADSLIVCRCGAETKPPSVLQRRSTTADGEAVGTASMMAAAAVAISLGDMPGHSIAECCVSTTSITWDGGGGSGGVRGHAS